MFVCTKWLTFICLYFIMRESEYGGAKAPYIHIRLMSAFMPASCGVCHTSHACMKGAFK